MGKHYLLNLYDCPFDILNNELFLTQVITEDETVLKLPALH